MQLEQRKSNAASRWRDHSVLWGSAHDGSYDLLRVRAVRGDSAEHNEEVLCESVSGARCWWPAYRLQIYLRAPAEMSIVPVLEHWCLDGWHREAHDLQHDLLRAEEEHDALEDRSEAVWRLAIKIDRLTERLDRVALEMSELWDEERYADHDSSWWDWYLKGAKPKVIS